MRPFHILQFICSTGFYGAERWILALTRNSHETRVKYSLATTLEDNSEDLELVREYKNDGGETFQLPMKHPFDLGVIKKLVLLIKEQNISAIHTHGYKSDILGVIAAKKAGIPVVVTPHGFENAADIKLRSFIWLGCQAMKFADKVVPLSPQLMQDVAKFGIRAPQLVYIQNGVDLSEVNDLGEKSAVIVKEKKRIGFIGQMIKRKNIKDILDIFDDIHNESSNVELILLGDGEERKQLEIYASTLSSVGDIHFLGYRDDRLDYLRSFDLFVMTSTLEGIPRCLMEACAMGIPVAAYNIPGINQLVKHRSTGLLAPLHNKEVLVEYWKKLLNDKSLADNLSNNARNYVNSEYSAKRMADEYLTLFKELLT